MPNRLANENSPYLLQHADNPVDWYPWGEEALEKARQEDKPIFLSIGYAACHWCHVMAHESFEDPRTARIMNEHFVNIKVDREERPDLDSLYMNAVVAMTGQGGWPMSVFLTPQGEPFYAGTYFPPVRRYNMPSFSEVLISLAEVWKNERDKVLSAAREVVEHLRKIPEPGGGSEALNAQTLEEAAFQLAQSYDWEHGGWGSAPKFPQPMAIEFLLRRAVRGDHLARDISVHCLYRMAQGGMYDVVGGGFSRYSTDDDWLVPHFEKMLYDNAQLALVYLHAHLVTGDSFFRRICEETLDFILRELSTHLISNGTQKRGFFSSLDADSEGEEGKYYLWSPDEIRAAFDSPQDVEIVLAAYGVTEKGNFEGRNVLQRRLTDKEISTRFSIPEADVPHVLSKLHRTLLHAREKRVRPATDDKILVSWNALALRAFAEAGRYLKRPNYTEVARYNADFILAELFEQDRLRRSWREGRAQHDAYLEDYAGLILALLALYQSDPDPWWFHSAAQLTEQMIEGFTDPAGGFFDTHQDSDPLIIRPKELQDNATPSGNSLAAMALLQLSAFTGSGEWRTYAERMLSSIQSTVARYPTAFGNWLCAIDMAVNPLLEIALLGPQEHPTTSKLREVIWSAYRPYAVYAASDYPPPPNAPLLLLDRPLIDNQPTVYVCQNFICQQPVTGPETLAGQLESIVSTH